MRLYLINVVLIWIIFNKKMVVIGEIGKCSLSLTISLQEKMWGLERDGMTTSLHPCHAAVKLHVSWMR